MIRGLIFDMDGVLLDTEHIYFTCWQKSAREFGFDMKPNYALAVRSCCQQYAEPYLKRMLGETFDYVAVRDRRRELVAQYMEENGIQPKPYVRELMRFCKVHGIHVAIATATTQALAKKRMEMAGLGGLFSNIVGGDEVKCGKPAPDIYQIAARELHLDPEECMALEDSPNGIFSAFTAGCKTVMVPDLTRPEYNFQPLLYGVAADLRCVVPILEASGIPELQTV